jgi:hypothetical protein
MDRRRAETKAEERNRDHPEREQWEWRAVPRGGDAWAIVRTPRRPRVDPLTTTTEPAPKPPQPDEPWSGPIGQLPGYR